MIDDNLVTSFGNSSHRLLCHSLVRLSPLRSNAGFRTSRSTQFCSYSLSFRQIPVPLKKYAIIVAGGTGSRMGGDVPKQFMLLNHKPVLYYSLKNFLDAFDDLETVLVLPVAFLDEGQEIIDAYFDKQRVRITTGGDTRFQSVKNGLRLIEEESIIFVHDAVRCLASTELIRRCYEIALQTGSAVPVVPARDTIRFINGEGSDTIDRRKVVMVQTPQTFHSKILLPAYEIDYKDKFTDEATVVEAYGLKVSLTEGEETNIKITRPVDLVIAENILEEKL
jgi:2-C-methyl-D-erythritol 4-phosphate cytidylyltransferase